MLVCSLYTRIRYQKELQLFSIVGFLQYSPKSMLSALVYALHETQKKILKIYIL